MLALTGLLALMIVIEALIFDMSKTSGLFAFVAVLFGIGVWIEQRRPLFWQGALTLCLGLYAVHLFTLVTQSQRAVAIAGAIEIVLMGLAAFSGARILWNLFSARR